MPTRKSKRTKRAFHYPSIADGISRKKEISNYDKTLESVMINKGYNPNTLKEVLRKISWHETGGTLDPKILQKGASEKIGGKGLYQYEPESLKTAINRAKNYFKSTGEDTPKWLTDVNTTDATTLDAETQSSLALLDMVQRPGFNIKQALESDEGLIESWGKGWQTENDPVKKNKFKKDLDGYYKEFNKPKEVNISPAKPAIPKMQDSGKLKPKQRQGVYQNEDGTVSTHRMTYTEADGNYYAYPTLFQTPEGDWYEKSDKDNWAAFDEAKRLGEIHEFKQEIEAKNFSEGNWKRGYERTKRVESYPKFQDGGKLPVRYNSTTEEALPTVSIPEVNINAYNNISKEDVNILRNTSKTNPIYRAAKMRAEGKQPGNYPKEIDQSLKALWEIPKEVTGYNAAKRVKKRGIVNTLKDIGKTVEDVILGSTPYSGTLTPEPEWDGLQSTLDVAELLPYGAGAMKLGTKGMQKGVSNFSKSFALDNLDDLGKQTFKSTPYDFNKKVSGTTGTTGKSDISRWEYKDLSLEDKIEFIKTVDNTITTKGNTILKDLKSEEGKKRLINQFREAEPGLSTKELENLYTNRIISVQNTIKRNRARWVKDVTKTKENPREFLNTLDLDLYFPFENAHYSPRSLYKPSEFQKASSAFSPNRNSFKSNRTNFLSTDPSSGYISLGKGYEKSGPTVSHEVGHALQKGSPMPIDRELRGLINSAYRGSGNLVKGYIDDIWRQYFSGSKNPNKDVWKELDYFLRGSRGEEPYPFLRELREAMLENKVINKTYDEITPKKLKSFKGKPIGMQKDKRLLSFIPPWDRSKLAKIMNKAPVLVSGTVLATQLNKKQNRGVKKDPATGLLKLK